MLSDAVRSATVLGLHLPYIVVPPSLLNALTRDELDQIVLHEYAHVQRWDDWARLGQALLQSALWIHPAMAMIGRRLNLEREMACDEWVVARTGLPKAYARCLTRAAEVLGRIGMEPTLGPALFARRRDLVLRVNRLLTVRGRTRRNASVLSAVAGACALMVATIQLRAQARPGSPRQSAAHRERTDATERLGAQRRRWGVCADGRHDSASRASACGGTSRNSTRSHGPAKAGPYELHDRSTHGARRTQEPDEPYEPTNRRTHEPTNPRTQEPTNPRTDEPASALRAPAGKPGAPDAPIAPDSTPAVISARSFDGHYVVFELPAAAPESRAPRQIAGAVGAEIGASARKTSVGIANTFTRAGLSLARRF
jgi:hypothetical protein